MKKIKIKGVSNNGSFIICCMYRLKSNECTPWSVFIKKRT